MVRVFTFQSSDVIEIVLGGGTHVNSSQRANMRTRGKEDDIASIYRMRGMRLERRAVSVYHFVALNAFTPITIKSIYARLQMLHSYYNLFNRWLLELEIPEEEIVILSHPEYETRESPLLTKYEFDTIEGVTTCIKPEWVVSAYQLKQNYKQENLITFIPLKVSEETELKEELVVNMGNPYEHLGGAETTYLTTLELTPNALLRMHYGKEVGRVEYQQTPTGIKVTHIQLDEEYRGVSLGIGMLSQLGDLTNTHRVYAEVPKGHFIGKWLSEWGYKLSQSTDSIEVYEDVLKTNGIQEVSIF